MRIFGLLALSLAAVHSRAHAQDTPDAQRRAQPAQKDWVDGALDPDSPLADLPEMVDWPDQVEELPRFEEIRPDDTGEDELEYLEQEFSAEEAQGGTESFTVGTVTSTRPVRVGQGGNAERSEASERESDFAIRVNFLNGQQIPDTDLTDMESRFQSLSVLRGYDDGESNIAQLSRRATADEQLLSDIMRVYGYYDAETQKSITRYRRRGDGAVRTGNEIVFDVLAGPRYTIGEIALGDLQKAPNFSHLRAVYGLVSGDPVNSDDIALARAMLSDTLLETGFAFAEVGDPQLLINHATRIGDIDQPVTTGARYRFGPIIMRNTGFLSARHLQRIARFDPGDVYQRSMVEDLRRAIVATGLVSSVTIAPVDSDETGEIGDRGLARDPGDERTANIMVDLTPAPLRTIAGELGYGTGEGVRLEASWEHRNFFPPEGMIRFRGVAGTQEQLVSATYRRNNFRGRDKVLTAQILTQNINRDAYEANTLTLAASFERQTNIIFQKKWTWSVGMELLASRERDGTSGAAATQRSTYFIAALPTTLGYDGTSDLLNPGNGFRLSGLVTPEVSLQDGTFYYGRGQLDASYYQPAGEKLVIATRARLGTIIGAGTNEIAPSRRLYAGGGGSVRGYGYQMVGPRDAENDPVGGRGLVEFSLEARVRLGDFGVVPFIDAGNVYAKEWPDFTGLRYGAGIGVRYYTNFGPLRLDVATPINPRAGDGRIAVYISLGQAF